MNEKCNHKWITKTFIRFSLMKKNNLICFGWLKLEGGHESIRGHDCQISRKLYEAIVNKDTPDMRMQTAIRTSVTQYFSGWHRKQGLSHSTVMTRQ